MENEVTQIARKISNMVKIRFLIITVLFSFVFSFSKKVFLFYKDTSDISELRIMGWVILLAVLCEAFGVYLKAPFIGRRSKVDTPILMLVFRLFTYFFLLMMGMGLAFIDSNGEMKIWAFGLGVFLSFVWSFASYFIIDSRKKIILPQSRNYLETVADILLLIYSCVFMTFTWEFLCTGSFGESILGLSADVAKIILQCMAFLLFAIMYIAANYMHWLERSMIIKTTFDKFLMLFLLMITYVLAIS
ncbi:MAG: hypothetical protein V2A54_02625 [Bacteroidota bacterium]